MAGRHHDRELLDALEAVPAEAFSGTVWRITMHGRDPLRGSMAGGRWSPQGDVEVLYSSLVRDGALAEIGYRLSLEPVWPSRLVHEVHRIVARTQNSLRFADLASLEPLGIDPKRYATLDYTATQAVAAAAHFLGYDGLIVPSARYSDLNLVLFLERLDVAACLRVEASERVDWGAWRRSQEKAPVSTRRLPGDSPVHTRR
jgi:RES domain-containing protein